MNFLSIRKAKRIIGKNLIFRNAEVTDASFIFALRTDEKKSQNISAGAISLAEQEDWLRAYETRENEAYFIIENKTGTRIGTIRLYAQKEQTFCWGSWIVVDGAPQTVAAESMLMVYSYALDTLGFLSAYFQVNKENQSVWKFKERFGATRTAENEVEYHYIITGEAMRESMKRYQKLLPEYLDVEFL